MFKKLLDLIMKAVRRMVSYKDIPDVFPEVENGVSEDMQSAIDLWKDMYMDKSPWINEANGMYSMGIANEVCSELARQVTLELESSITESGEVTEGMIENEHAEDVNTRAKFLNNSYRKHLLSVLREKLEYGMAMGGMIIRPYVHGNNIYFDFNSQGDFIPLAFTDNGVITDVAFPDYFVDGKKRYVRVERHRFDPEAHTVTIMNRAFVTELTGGITSPDLGLEVDLKTIPKWAHLTPEPVIINNVDRPLYGYFRVPRANNVDTQSPLGVSVFSRACGMIHRADEQFSRLDWEYEGGQMAIDVDPMAIDPTNKNRKQSMYPKLNDRLFRSVDLGEDGTYQAFAPTLRDTNYINGLNTYLIRVEDLCELSRGSISNANNDARTATELIILRQRAYNNIKDNQKALESTLKDVVYAMNVYAELYGLSKDGEYVLTCKWDDSIMQDSSKKLEEKLKLKEAGVLSAAEVRSDYTGETLEVAEQKVNKIQEDLKSQITLKKSPEYDDNRNYHRGSEAMQEQNSVATP